MKILREVQGVEEPEEQDGKTVKKEMRIAMKPVEGQEVQDTVNEEKKQYQTWKSLHPRQTQI